MAARDWRANSRSQPLASAASGQNIRLCPVCNRSNHLGRGPCVLDQSSAPPNVDAFRIIDSPTNIIVTERFVEELQGFNCGNVVWAEVQTR